MKTNPTLYEISPLMVEVLQTGGVLHLKPMGLSMLPLIRQKRDEIWLKSVELPIRKNQIYLFRRSDGSFVLHRCISVRPNGLTFRGDNQLKKERGIQPTQLVAELDHLCRKGKMMQPDSFEFRMFARIALPYFVCRYFAIRALRPVRFVLSKFLRKK